VEAEDVANPALLATAACVDCPTAWAVAAPVPVATPENVELPTADEVELAAAAAVPAFVDRPTAVAVAVPAAFPVAACVDLPTACAVAWPLADPAPVSASDSTCVVSARSGQYLVVAADGEYPDDEAEPVLFATAACVDCPTALAVAVPAARTALVLPRRQDTHRPLRPLGTGHSLR